MQELSRFLKAERSAGVVMHPKPSEFFAALEITPLESVRAVILGQDPYHGPGQAHGLSFSVAQGVAPPPSLQNIFKELSSDLRMDIPTSGSLVPWAKQGVLLLNSVLSVATGRPASHQGKGWEFFTDHVIQTVNDARQGVAFVLWGSAAQKKGARVDRSKHLVIESPHPSPLSAYRGFFGSRPFSRINTYLESQGRAPIDWRL
jgi:uracil-DNA glycosylase